MRSLLLALLLLAPAFPAHAQSDAPSAPAVTTDGTLGLAYVFGGSGEGLPGASAGLNIRLRQHALGARASFFERFSLDMTRRWEIGAVYSFTIEGAFSLGAGVSYSSEQYRTTDDEGRADPSSFGIPLEATFRLPGPSRFSPFLRGFTTMRSEGSFGGLSLGATF